MLRSLVTFMNLMDKKHELDVKIADTLEKIQHISPGLYGHWYSKLYPVKFGPGEYWTCETLDQLNNILKQQIEQQLDNLQSLNQMTFI